MCAEDLRVILIRLSKPCTCRCIHTLQSARYPIGKDPIDDPKDKEQPGTGIIVGKQRDNTEQKTKNCPKSRSPYGRVKGDPVSKTNNKSLECPAVEDHHHEPGLWRYPGRGKNQQASCTVQSGENTNCCGNCDPLFLNHNQTPNRNGVREKLYHLSIPLPDLTGMGIIKSRPYPKKYKSPEDKSYRGYP
jgi:hypothetical protein